ncbi:helix-turn-helix transcriptional regulator [Fastidiosibacter lacustris]|uniref:helix-turn-helix transcriptional regulator n=1 Tax=Fastidiosibacter lacustris TaxID=2056695 RepID=UPI000E348927|nr:hypothetical protein [Fastidiosibacter lacustris]
MEQNLIQNRVMERNVHDIKLLVKPLERIGLNYFTFDANYLDGSHVRLTTHSDWIQHYYDHKLYNVAIFEKGFQHMQDGHILWEWVQSPVYREASDFGIENGITIIKKHTTKTKFYHFGFHRHVSLEHNDLGKILSALHAFINYFNDKASHIITEAENQKIIIPDFVIKPSSVSISDQIINELVTVLDKSTSKIYIDSQSGQYITRQERRILNFLKGGLNLKETASKRCRSVKTVDNQLSTLKAKFECNTLYELAAKATKINL